MGDNRVRALSDNSKSYIEGNYNRMSLSELSQNLKISRTAIQKYMDERGIKRKIAAPKPKKSPVKEGCFDYDNYKSLI